MTVPTAVWKPKQPDPTLRGLAEWDDFPDPGDRPRHPGPESPARRPEPMLRPQGMVFIVDTKIIRGL
jgi:hypothetical protein